jgi:hypothetical protein
MFNDHLSNEMAKERLNERVKEVETYSLQKRLGYGDNEAARWVFVFIILVALVALVIIF